MRIPPQLGATRVCGMRQEISVIARAGDRARLDAVAADRNTPPKPVRQARNVLFTGDGLGTSAGPAPRAHVNPPVDRHAKRGLHLSDRTIAAMGLLAR